MPSSKTSLATLLSVIIPGAGQFYLKRRGRGVLIFLTAVLLVFLVFWSQNTVKVGILNLGGLAVTWLVASAGPVLGLECARCPRASLRVRPPLLCP